MKFKVGDTVKVLDNCHDDEWINVGEIVTIDEIDEDDVDGLPYNCSNNKYNIWLGDKHIELVKTEVETINFNKLKLLLYNNAMKIEINPSFRKHDNIKLNDDVLSILIHNGLISSYGANLNEAKMIRDTINNIITYFEQNAKTKKKMTLKEIEDKLGYEIEIV